MRRTIWRYLAVATITFTALAVSSCSQGTASTTATSGATSSALPTDIPSGTKLIIADQGQRLQTALKLSGQLDKLTFTVQFAQFNGMEQVLEAVRGGAADIGYGGDISVSFARASGLDAKSIGVVRTSRNYYTFLTAPGRGNIASAADLKGKKVAYAAGTQLGLYTLRVLDSVGLSIHDVNLVRLTIPDIPDALRTGQVDAAAIYEPNTSNFLSDYGSQGLHVLPEGKDKGTGLNYLWTTSQVLQSQAKTAAAAQLSQAFTRAYLWQNSHSDQWAQGFFVDVQQLAPDVAKKVVASLGEVSIPRTDQALIDEQQTYIDFLVLAGEIPQTHNAADEFDLRFDAVQYAATQTA